MGKRRGKERETEERGMEHNIDYLIMHFIISVTTECLPSLAGRPTCAAAPPFNEVDKERSHLDIFTSSESLLSATAHNGTLLSSDGKATLPLRPPFVLFF